MESNGFLASGTDEWIDHLSALIESTDLRSRLEQRLSRRCGGRTRTIARSRRFEPRLAEPTEPYLGRLVIDVRTRRPPDGRAKGGS